MSKEQHGDTMLRKITNRFADMIVQEMNNDEMRDTIRVKLLNPLLHMIFNEVHPYIYGLFITVFLILLLSLMTFVLFLLSIFPRKHHLRV
jgi:hypothetical protein